MCRKCKQALEIEIKNWQNSANWIMKEWRESYQSFTLEIQFDLRIIKQTISDNFVISFRKYFPYLTVYKKNLNLSILKETNIKLGCSPSTLDLKSQALHVSFHKHLFRHLERWQWCLGKNQMQTNNNRTMSLR